MFEVIQAGNRWTWQMICSAGRVLAYTSETYDDDLVAAEAAKGLPAQLLGHGRSG
jgi:hypothetical protein